VTGGSGLAVQRHFEKNAWGFFFEQVYIHRWQEER
jgi:hypothetical protein